jgi:hypothetical protein
LGIDHIADFKGYDHILFIVTLCAVYQYTQWKNILVLVTAFTVGHSTTLVLATLRIVTVRSSLIEFLIPLTIFITGLSNLISNHELVSEGLQKMKYGASMFFGLIHGLGFSSYLRSLLGRESDIVLPLFAFNVGIEAGQLIIVSCIFMLTFLFVNIIHLKRKIWNIVLSLAGMTMATWLMIQRWPF